LSKKKTITSTIFFLIIAWVGLFLVWNSVSLDGMNPTMNFEIDFGKIGSVILNKIADIVRQFIQPR